MKATRHVDHGDNTTNRAKNTNRYKNPEVGHGLQYFPRVATSMAVRLPSDAFRDHEGFYQWAASIGDSAMAVAEPLMPHMREVAARRQHAVTDHVVVLTRDMRLASKWHHRPNTSLCTTRTPDLCYQRVLAYLLVVQPNDHHTMRVLMQSLMRGGYATYGMVPVPVFLVSPDVPVNNPDGYVLHGHDSTLRDRLRLGHGDAIPVVGRAYVEMAVRHLFRLVPGRPWSRSPSLEECIWSVSDRMAHRWAAELMLSSMYWVECNRYAGPISEVDFDQMYGVYCENARRQGHVLRNESMMLGLAMCMRRGGGPGAHLMEVGWNGHHRDTNPFALGMIRRHFFTQ